MSSANLSMKNIMNFIVPITRFNRGEANKIFDEVNETGVKIVMKNNVRVGVLVEPGQYDEMVEMLEDYALFFEAEQRLRKAEQEVSISEMQIMEDLGIRETDLEEIDVELE